MDITLDDRLNALQQISQRKLIDILDGIPGMKDLIIEQKLMKILDSFVGVSVLKRYGIDKIYKMEQGIKPSNTHRIFLISSDLITCKRVLDQIQSEILPSAKPYVQQTHHLLVIPFVPAVLHNIIEEEGLAGLVNVHSLAQEFIRLDGNVLSLENSLFADLYYHKDTMLLPALARSLWSLQLILGAPKCTLSFGQYSQQTLKLIGSIGQSLGNPSGENEIGAFIVMDRNYDFVSTLLTPVTYGSLLNEVVDINVGTATLGKSQTKLDPNRDHIYEEVRDRSCSDVFPILHEKAKSLKSEQAAIQTMKLAEMERYVATRLQKTRDTTRQLAFHINACQAIADNLGSEFQVLQATEKSIVECKERKETLNYIENNIDDRAVRSLRLLCLLSITSDGVTQNEITPVQKSYLHAHGYQNIPLFYKLKTVGLLRYRTGNILQKLPNWNSEWLTNAQRMKLIPNHSPRSDQKTSCPSYVFSNAYIPFIAQVLSIVANQEKDSRSLEDFTNLPNCALNGQRGSLLPKMVVICIVGGISSAEIAACRLVAKTTGIRLVLASDSIINGNKLIEKIQEV